MRHCSNEGRTNLTEAVLTNIKCIMTFFVTAIFFSALACLAVVKTTIVQDNYTFEGCSQFVMESPNVKDRVDAAKICNGDINTDCVNWVFQDVSVTSREKAVALCKKGATMSCLNSVYGSTSVKSRVQAVEICNE